MLLRRVYHSYRETNRSSSRVFCNEPSDNDAGFTLVTGRKNSVTHIKCYTFSSFVMLRKKNYYSFTPNYEAKLESRSRYYSLGEHDVTRDF